MACASSAEQENVLGRPERILPHVTPEGHEHIRGHHWPRSVSADESSVARTGAERFAILPRIHELVHRHESHRAQRRRLLQTQLDGDARAGRHETLARIRAARSRAKKEIIYWWNDFFSAFGTFWIRSPAKGARSFCPPGLCSSVQAVTSFCRIPTLDWRWPLPSLETVIFH